MSSDSDSRVIELLTEIRDTQNGHFAFMQAHAGQVAQEIERSTAMQERSVANQEQSIRNQVQSMLTQQSAARISDASWQSPAQRSRWVCR